MVPFITKGGANFRRAWLYFCHDKQASTTERVEWIEFRNLLTDCPRQAWRFMEYTHKSRHRLKHAAGRGMGGREVLKPCYSYSLSWHPDENPSREEMVALADESLRVLGLEEHQAMIVSHTDEPHPHCHVIINRVHPETGIAESPSHSKRKLSELALSYERSQGVLRCPARIRRQGQRRRGQDEKSVPEIISNAWFGSVDPGEFVGLLQREGYHLAADGQRILVMGPSGEIINPVRHLEGVSVKDFRAAMNGLFLKSLPTLEEIRQRNGGAKDPQTSPDA